MFTKKKKKPQISHPTNFEHRVHTGFDKREGKFVGLPLQWASIVGNNQILKSTNRPLPLVDPSEITPTEILDLKVSFPVYPSPKQMPSHLYFSVFPSLITTKSTVGTLFTAILINRPFPWKHSYSKLNFHSRHGHGLPTYRNVTTSPFVSDNSPVFYNMGQWFSSFCACSWRIWVYSIFWLAKLFRVLSLWVKNLLAVFEFYIISF